MTTDMETAAASFEWLTVIELADRWRVAPGTIRRWASNGHLDGVRLPGGHWRFRLQAIEAFERTGVVVG